MRVFKFQADGYQFAVGAKTQEDAKAHLDELTTCLEEPTVTEIPESGWDDRLIAMHEDNDWETTPFYMSIREIMCGEEPQLLFTNDPSLMN